MQNFAVRVETRLPGRPPLGDEFTVEANDEMSAGEIAKIKARDKHAGGTPLVKGIRPSGSAWEVNPENHMAPTAQDEEAPDVVKATTAETAEGLRDYDRPTARPYAEWNKMQWFTLRKYAFHAARVQPKDKTEALVMLQERGLVTA